MRMPRGPPPPFTEEGREAMTQSIDERRASEAILLKNIKRDLAALTRLSEEADSHWGSEDLVYRFYHQSFKVFAIQSLTMTIVAALQSRLPEAAFDERFAMIIREGTEKEFSYEMNARWDAVTRPSSKPSSTRTTS